MWDTGRYVCMIGYRLWTWKDQIITCSYVPRRTRRLRLNWVAYYWTRQITHCNYSCPDYSVLPPYGQQQQFPNFKVNNRLLFYLKAVTTFTLYLQRWRSPEIREYKHRRVELDNTGNSFLQLRVQWIWKALLHVLTSTSNIVTQQNFVVPSWRKKLSVQVSSTCCNMLLQLATKKFCWMTMFEVVGNTCNNAFLLAMQQCCVSSCSN